MKKIKFFFAFMGVFALLFYACSKDENDVKSDEKATLSFGAIVQDLANKATNKQNDLGIPMCSEDAAAYVEIVLMQGETAVVGGDAPFRVDLVAGQVFTEEVPELELEPNTYSLTHFAVYDAGGDLIWLAPKSGSELANFVDNPLPLDISLGAGVKKYVDVPVLCYDDREVNQYGYLFFEFNETEAFEFCFFANYCPPEDEGRHETANYSVNIWWGTDDTGTPLYTNETPVVGVNNAGDFFAEPTCFALPVNDDLDEPYLYYEVTLLDWSDNYGPVAPGTVISGTLTAQDIMDNFVGEDNVNPEHLRFNCPPIGGGDCPEGDMDGDGICDDDDNCPENANPDQTDTDGDGVGDACDNCPEDTNADQADNDGDGAGNVCDDTPDGDVPCVAKGGDTDGDGICNDDDNCPNVPNQNQEDTDGDGTGDACDDTPGGDNPCVAKGGDSDGDGVCNDDDNCPNEYNPDQTDRDGDGIGDVCDECPDYGDENNECPQGQGCDTAYMLGDQPLNALSQYPGNNWGWGLILDFDEFEAEYDEGDGVWKIPFYAGAGQNDVNKGWLAGYVVLTVDGDELTITFDLEGGVTMEDDPHIWFSSTGWPDKRAPGWFDLNTNTFNLDGGDDTYYLIVHGGVCH